MVGGVDLSPIAASWCPSSVRLVCGLVLRVPGLGLRFGVKGWVEGLGFGISGFGSRVEGAHFRI